MVLASAVKWAEMAADYENGRNSKNFFASVRAHHVTIWLLLCNIFSDLHSGTQNLWYVTAQNLPILALYQKPPPTARFKPKTLTIGPRHIPWLGTSDIGTIQLLDQIHGSTDIGILSQQYT